jgi:hypothetical protein
MATTVSYKHYGGSGADEVGNVFVTDEDFDPSEHRTEVGPGAAELVFLPVGKPVKGITEMGLMSRQDAEALAAEHGVALSEH